MAGKKGGDPARYATIKVRLYPTPAQAELFEKAFGRCRCIRNQMLAGTALERSGGKRPAFWEDGLSVQ